MENFIIRAKAAWLRSGAIEQPSNDSEIREHDGKKYVVLVNVRGVLAVYRIKNDEALKRLRRYPKELIR